MSWQDDLRPIRAMPKRFPRPERGFVVYCRNVEQVDSPRLYLNPPVRLDTEEELFDWLDETMCPFQPQRGEKTGRIYHQVINFPPMQAVILNFNPEGHDNAS